MIYRIEYLTSLVEEDIPQLSKGARRLRVGDWRVICKIESPDGVLFVKIGDRREIYED